MATKIRLKRLGGKHDPHFRIVVIDGRARRDGRTIEELGFYKPTTEPATVEVNRERTLHWLGTGAQPSETVRSLLRREGILAEAAGATKTGPSAEAVGDGDEPEAEPETEDATDNRGDREAADE